MTDLKAEAVKELSGRTIAEWKAIAEEADVSESMIEKLGRDQYDSSPAYDKLLRIVAAVKKFPRQVAA